MLLSLDLQDPYQHNRKNYAIIIFQIIFLFRKFTLVCAINNKKIIGWTLYENGGMNGERMVQFIDDFIVGKYKKHLIIMDNGGAHKT